jgi:hypothetical protein
MQTFAIVFAMPLIFRIVDLKLPVDEIFITLCGFGGRANPEGDQGNEEQPC